MIRLLFAMLASTLGWVGAVAYSGWRPPRRCAFLIAAGVLAGFGVWHVGRAVRMTAHDLPRWDFLCFYLFGRVAVLARNVYDPALYHQFGAGLATDPDWVREVLDVGFPYPPDSIVVSYLLGFFATPQAAFVPWYALLLAGLVACVAFARRYVGGPWIPGTLVTLAFVTLWSPTGRTLQIGQTIFLVVAFVFAYACERRDWRAGLWLGLAVVVKPFVLVLALVPLLRREWNVLGGLAATLLGAFALATALVGPASIRAYVAQNPIERYPAIVYVEDGNISLSAAFLRARGTVPTHVSLAHETAFLLCALAFVAATALLISRTRTRERDDYALALAVCCALVVFPQTLDFYTFALLVPFAILWKRVAAERRLATAAVIAADATLAGVAHGSAGTAVLLLNWVGFAYLAGKR